MSTMGAWQTATMTSSTRTSEIDLGKDFANVLVLIPTLGVSADTTIEIARESGGTFFPMYRLDGDSAVSLEGINTSATQTMAIIYPCGAQYIKILCSASQTSETFYVRGLD